MNSIQKVIKPQIWTVPDVLKLNYINMCLSSLNLILIINNKMKTAVKN